MNSAERVRFVEEISLGEVCEAAGSSLSTTRFDSGGAVDDFVADGSIVSFSPQFDSRLKSDVLNSLLFAQLGASHAYDRYTETTSWYKFFLEILERIGWATVELKSVRFQADRASFEVYKVVLKVLAAALSEDQLAALKEIFLILDAEGDDSKALKIFDSASFHQELGNFQVASAQLDDGSPELTIGGFHLEARQKTKSFLFFKFSSSETEFFYSSGKTQLDLDVFNQVRQGVIMKLGDAAKRLVAEIELE